MKATTVAGVALLWASASWAADDIKPLDVKPGLWETKASTETAGMPKMPAAQMPLEALSKLPPEQRAKMEAMMKSRAAGGPMVTTTRTCITRESLSSGRAFARVQASCANRIIASTSSKLQIHMECNEGMKMTGDMTVERLDAEHTKGSMVMKGGQPEHPIETKMSFETRWLAADCGDVKPAVAK